MLKFEYTLTRRRRKTLALNISDGKVRVCAPLYVSDEFIRAFLERKQSWVLKKLAEWKSNNGRFARVIAGETLLDAGEEKHVLYGGRNKGEVDGVIRLSSPRSVRKFFSDDRADLLIERVYAWSRRIGVEPSDVRICDYKARWGCCDVHGVIKLNWRLPMLPIRLSEYIIIHEICHLRALDHSPQFWAEVGKYCPAFRACRKALREYSFLTGLYRSANSAE